jgi:TolB-like protein/class 3 adenylate cyclase
LGGERVERRLAAVLAADIAGYSRLMGADEVGTARILREHRAVTDALVAKHGGRLVKTTGDGVLLEFPSVVDAVECAVAVQAVMDRRNEGVPADRRMLFRVGINLGDILIEGDDILGDGVNIAARLEGIAEPGGIRISSSAYDQVRGKVEVEFADLGEQRLKNIDRPVRVYAAKKSGHLWMITPGALLSHPETQKPLLLPDKPSIAVLPFQNLSGDPEQEYFADGMVEEIITALSRFKSLFVIARNSSFTYKGKAVDIKQVGRELGVRYVLEGSVRKAGNRVRITGQLIEAATNRHLWADRFDGPLEDVFGLQDQVASSVVGLIAPQLEQAEIERSREKPTDRLDSYDLYLRGMEMLRSNSFHEARELFGEAFRQDPKYGNAYAMAAWTLAAQQAVGGVLLSAEMRADALQLADVGSRLANDDALAQARCGHALTYLGREFDRGASMVDRAVTLNPNLAVAWVSRGWVAAICCEAETAIESFNQMIRLSPLDPSTIGAWNGIAFAHFIQGRYEEGRASALKAVNWRPNAVHLGAYIINSVYADRLNEAREAVTQLQALYPTFRASHSEHAFPVRLPEVRNRMITALCEAGVPE